MMKSIGGYDMAYSVSGFKPFTRAADAWLSKAFAAIDGDLTSDQVETIADMARAAGFQVGRHS